MVTASLRSVAVPQFSDALLLLGFAGVATAITRVLSLSTSLIAHCYGLQLNLSECYSNLSLLYGSMKVNA